MLLIQRAAAGKKTKQRRKKKTPPEVFLVQKDERDNLQNLKEKDQTFFFPGPCLEHFSIHSQNQ